MTYVLYNARNTKLIYNSWQFYAERHEVSIEIFT